MSVVEVIRNLVAVAHLKLSVSTGNFKIRDAECEIEYESRVNQLVEPIIARYDEIHNILSQNFALQKMRK
jgi:hypothetical protein